MKLINESFLSIARKYDAFCAQEWEIYACERDAAVHAAETARAENDSLGQGRSDSPGDPGDNLRDNDNTQTD